MKSGFISNKFHKLFLTASVSNIVALLLAISEMMIAGNLIGELGLTAVNLVSPLYLVTQFFGGMNLS